MKDALKEFWLDVGVGILVFIAILTLLIFLSGCSLQTLFDKQKKEQASDSTSVKKETESFSKVDSTKSKSEATNTKETVYYPQPIIVPGRDGETKVVFVPQTVTESGTVKEEKQNFNFEDWYKRKEDSAKIAQLQTELDKKSKTEGSVLSVGQLIGIAFIGITFIGLLIALVYFKNQITNIKTLITKT
jgi:hypothetical protein